MKVSYIVYRIIRAVIQLFYPHIRFCGTENLPTEPCIVVGNHCQSNGPITAQLYFPGRKKIWCIGSMMETKTVPDYAFEDFWSIKPWYTRWFFRLLSYFVAPFASAVFNNADCIPVYRDNRLISTFRQTNEALELGNSIIVFPEHDPRRNQILSEFEDKFVDTARFYYRKTGKALSFVPMYLAPTRKEAHIGKPIVFRPEAPIDEERKRICAYLQQQITEMAEALPEHTVIPYRRLPGIPYNTNRPESFIPDDTSSSLGFHKKYYRKNSFREKWFGTPQVDYRQLRLSNVHSPEFEHVLLLIGWIVYFLLYFITEHFIPVSACHVIHSTLDDLVPFCPPFVIFYCFWFILVIGSLLYFLLYDIESFKNLQIFIMVTQAIAMIAYIFYPSVQHLRPETFPQQNAFTWVLSIIYAFDTPTGVCPSLHVGYSMGILSVWLKKKDVTKGWKAFIAISVILICMSVSFVKQHSVLDILWALPLSAFAELYVFLLQPALLRRRHREIRTH